MNNNRGNNRRRGRGNNRQQGGQQTNRIDSRARGNAPQLLEKYRKLAHDAHLNGDRVTEEYYLQFADHYFRVLADQKQRQDEARQPRRDDRSSDQDDDGSDDDIYGDNTQSSGGDRYGNSDRAERHGGNDRGERAERSDRGERNDRGDRHGGNDRNRRPERPVETAESAPEQVEGSSEPAESAEAIYEPAENPFVRDNRSTRGLKPRKPRGRPRNEDGEPAAATEENTDTMAEKGAEEGNFDPAVLPPSISSKSTEKAPKTAKAPKPEAEEGAAAEEKPKRRRTRKAATPAEDSDGTLEAVNG